MSDIKLIANGTVVTAEGEFAGDILIDGEKIAAVGRITAPDSADVVDASGCFVLPGLIDNHTHLSMPFMGMMSSDDYDTGTRAAAAGGTTCLVDFAIQRQPDNLQSALEEWHGRADGAAHVDYGFHMAITNASDPVLDEMTAMAGAGICSFKLFMAYKGALMVRDDELAACMERARDLGALTMVHAENGDIVDLLVRRALARGDTSAIHHALTRPEFVEAEATGRAARIAEHLGAPLFVVHVTCAAAAAEIEAAQQRGVPVSGETCFQYLTNAIDDLHRPGVEGCRYICSPPLRDASNHEPLWGYVQRGVLESVSTDHCPFNDEQKAHGLEDFSIVPNGLALIQHRLTKLWDEGVVAGRITRPQLVDRTSTTIARRFGLHHKGALAPGKDADVVVLDPAAPRPYGISTSFMNVDYDLYEGETASASVRHTFCRGTLVYDRGEIKTEPGHGRFVPRKLGQASMSAVRLDPQAVIADLNELADQSGGRFAGAKRLAWSQEWREARSWLTWEAAADLGLEPEQDQAGNLWARIDGGDDNFLIVGSHIDAVPDGGWLDGALGLMTALETVRQLTRMGSRPALGVRFVDWADEEGARFGRSLLGSSACAGNLDPSDVRELRDANGMTLAEGLAECGVDLDDAPAAAARLDGAVAYLELHIEQGPVLLDGGRLAAAVSGTFGDERHLVTFVGQAAHAGSTPMRLRQDSLAAAARAALEIRQSAISHGGVATVGRMHSTPGVITAVAGRTEMQLDQRHLDPTELAEMLGEAEEACRNAAAEFNCSLEIRTVFSASPTPFDGVLVELASSSVEEAGAGAGGPIPSGPLHDATEIGRVVPTAMIFAQSDPPISHAAIEDSSERALGVAIDAYGRTVEQVLARASEFTSQGAGRS